MKNSNTIGLLIKVDMDKVHADKESIYIECNDEESEKILESIVKIKHS